MRTVSAGALLLLVAATAIAFDPLPGTRIAVLLPDTATEERLDPHSRDLLRLALIRELRALGYNAFEARATFNDLEREPVAAELLLEFVSTHSDALGNAPSAALTIRVYDGATRQIVATVDASAAAAYMPVRIGFGGPLGAATLAIDYARWRKAVNLAARRAAAKIDLVASEARAR